MRTLLAILIGSFLFSCNTSNHNQLSVEGLQEWTYYIRLDIKLRDLELHQLTLNYEKTKQELQSII